MKEYDVVCPYCNKDARLVTGEIIYPHRSDLYHLLFYHCALCDAFVGCHKKGWNNNGRKPLGTLANGALRTARRQAHLHFDKYWKSGKYNRTHCYQMLSEYLGTEFNDTHIGMFNMEQCKKTIYFKPTRKKEAV